MKSCDLIQYSSYVLMLTAGKDSKSKARISLGKARSQVIQYVK